QQQLQQNSTLIDDNLDSCPMLLNLPESPILPTKHQHYQRGQNQEDNNNRNREQLVNAANGQNQQYASSSSSSNNNNNRVKAKASGNGQHTSGAGRRQRHRSISLYGVNSTVEQGHKEIPIWLDDDEPRYVSGVTNKTTCNDIIKALIDDELKHNNYRIDGGQGSAASRDYSDYVITERWRGIERSYDGNMAILPVWRAWSRVHNELRLSLKLRRELKEPPPLPLQQRQPELPLHAPHATSSSFSVLKWLRKLLRLSSKAQKGKSKAEKAENKAMWEQRVPDELLLVLLPDQHYETGSGAAKPEHKIKAKLYKLAETRVTQRQRRRSRRHATHALESSSNNNNNNNKDCQNNCIRRRRKEAPLRNSVRNKLAALHADMNVRYEREYNLTRQLSEKCKQYKLQNELYTSPEMELSVGQLQRNIEAYGEDIIKTEHELLELKLEIKQDISLINNLKRMTLEQNAVTGKVGKAQEVLPQSKSEETPKVIKNAQEMQFVDNIYEFCDNNASMLV
ncbi:hypothetical protein KR222_004517, partial [Zaprionus bogoriensis]